MKTTQTNELTFYTIIGKSGAELTGVDVGRTHGIHSYTRNGKYVGVHSWTGRPDCSGEAMRESYYEVASYLWEVYK